MRRRIRKLSIARRIFATFIAAALIGFILPERLVIPVERASVADWNEDSFWYEPWGKSGVHKGIDIFAPKGRNVIAATGGVVVFQGKSALGGIIVLVLGPKWRIHYYAHLDSSAVSIGDFVAGGEVVGAVGDTGNAKGKPSHLHYVILSVFPIPWLMDTGTQGWKRMFYLDPNAKLRAAQNGEPDE